MNSKECGVIATFVIIVTILSITSMINGTFTILQIQKLNAQKASSVAKK
ncbi:MAG: hypothetical protein ABJB76_09735 [Candidatus Nitrosocosmicus sp.]